MVKFGDILSLALLGGLGYAAYQIYTGNWKLPGLPELPTPDPQTLEETGVVGGIGDIIYNITSPDLRERVEAGLPQTIAEHLALTGEMPTQEQIGHRTVARTVSQDIIDRGLPGIVLPGLNAVTIGGGLAAIQRQESYIQSLPGPVQKQVYRAQTVKRAEHLLTPMGVIAGILAGPIGLPAAILPDLIRGLPSMPKETAEQLGFVPEPEVIEVVKEPPTVMGVSRKTFLEKLRRHDAG